MREDRHQGFHMDMEPTNRKQTMIELIAIVNLAGAFALLLWRE